MPLNWIRQRSDIFILMHVKVISRLIFFTHLGNAFHTNCFGFWEAESPQSRSDFSGAVSPSRTWATWQEWEMRKGMCMCVFEGCFKLWKWDNEALHWFLGAVPTVLSYFFIHFLKSQDKRVLCYTDCAMLKLPLDEVERTPTNFNGALEKAHCAN